MEELSEKGPLAIILFGVSGSGKTTVGKLLAEALQCDFFDGDDYHPLANKEKMKEGVPLDDADRWPWLAVLRELLTKVLAQGGVAVLACSALHRSYREYLNQPGVRFVQLKGDAALIRQRLENRQGHFFNPELLTDQLETWEDPRARVLTVDIAKTPAGIVDDILKQLGLER